MLHDVMTKRFSITMDLGYRIECVVMESFLIVYPHEIHQIQIIPFFLFANLERMSRLDEHS